MSGIINKTGKSIITVSRRDFIKFSGMAIIGAGVLGCVGPGNKSTWGFLLVDMKKCQGCTTCMLTCSLVHEGAVSMSHSRIQILQDSFGKFPDDVTISQCRQCVQAACLVACPTGALHRDLFSGNVATVDVKKCIGCKKCVNACPYQPARAIWNAEGKHSQKCDLCAGSTYWDEKGGPNGKKACLEICPVHAIIFTRVIPDQQGDDGYSVNLRDEEWGKLGFPID
jgi:protein NrfC